MTNIVEAFEAEQIEGKEIPKFSAGDTVVVQVKVKEGTRERLQAFEGVVIAIRNRGLNSSFTVRKVSHGEGVERVFQTYSTLVASIKVKRRGHVRRAKLYYLRKLSGRAARIKEKLIRRGVKTEVVAAPKKPIKEEPVAQAPKAAAKPAPETKAKPEVKAETSAQPKAEAAPDTKEDKKPQE